MYAQDPNDTPNPDVPNPDVIGIAAWRARRKQQQEAQPATTPPARIPHLVSLSGAGNAEDLYDYLGDINHAPRLFRKDNRFSFLARDPAHRGKIRPCGVREAMSIMFAEQIGLVPWPVARYPDPAYDFVDGSGAVIDVKTPISPNQGDSWAFSLQEVFGSIQHELKTGTRKDGPSSKILLDVSYLKQEDYQMLRRALDHHLSADARDRLIQVSIPFAKLAPRPIRRYRAKGGQTQHASPAPPPAKKPAPPSP